MSALSITMRDISKKFYFHGLSTSVNGNTDIDL
jgi:hypothetical protein